MQPTGVAWLLGLVMFAWGTLSDLRIRRVPNDHWIPFLLFAVMLWLGRLLSGDPGSWLVPSLWSLGATAFLYGAWWIGAFGGADAKGLMVFAWLAPATPLPLDGRITPALDALANGVLLMLVLPLLYLSLNLMRGRFAFPAALLGVPMDREAARRKHVWPLQHVVDGQVRWRFWNRPGDDLESTYDLLERHGVQQVWTTPKVPFMVPLTAGLVLAWLEGDLLLRIAMALAG